MDELQVTYDFTITSAEQDRQAADYGRELATRKKKLTEQRMAQTRPLDDSKAKIIAFFAPEIAKIEGTLKILDRAMIEWRNLEKMKIAEETARLRLEADAKLLAIQTQAAAEMAAGRHEVAAAVLALP